MDEISQMKEFKIFCGFRATMYSLVKRFVHFAPVENEVPRPLKLISCHRNAEEGLFCSVWIWKRR